jgi:hypothetical protein
MHLHSLTNELIKLTPISKFLEKLKSPQLVKNFSQCAEFKF